MTQLLERKTTTTNTIADLKKSNAPRFKFFSDSTAKAYKSKDLQDGELYVSFTASSTSEDLEGENFTLNALQVMAKSAVGTTIFMNHDTKVPDDVFGIVTKTEIVTGKSPVHGKDAYMLLYVVRVAKNNPAALRLYKLIEYDKIKIGASVTCLVPQNNKGTFEDVYYIECSLVGVPCNQDCWVKKAGKAIKSFNARNQNKKHFNDTIKKGDDNKMPQSNKGVKKSPSVNKQRQPSQAMKELDMDDLKEFANLLGTFFAQLRGESPAQEPDGDEVPTEETDQNGGYMDNMDSNAAEDEEGSDDSQQEPDDDEGSNESDDDETDTEQKAEGDEEMTSDAYADEQQYEDDFQNDKMPKSRKSIEQQLKEMQAKYKRLHEQYLDALNAANAATGLLEKLTSTRQQ